MKMSTPLLGRCVEGFASPADDARLLERQAAERRWSVMTARLAALLHERRDMARCPQCGDEDGDAA
jgi:hypothetical protein